MTLPTFLVIGAEKAGTTWLYDRLRRHPNIFMPSVKEIHYFNRLDSNLKRRDNYEKHGVDWYENHFQSLEGESEVGEATPMYLCDREAPKRIHEVIPNVKLIASLRYPPDRAHSHYWMARGKGTVSDELIKMVEAKGKRFIKRGYYDKQLERYYSYFDKNQILVVIHEELFSDPVQHLNRICSFLGVEEDFYQEQEWIYRNVNSSSAVRSAVLQRMIEQTALWMRDHELSRKALNYLKELGITDWLKSKNSEPRDYPPMSSEVQRKLDHHYISTIQGVEHLLGRQIKCWRRRTSQDISNPLG
jgi:hypothetical protein